MPTAVLVAYREAGFVAENAELLKRHGFEIIIAADEPGRELLRVIEDSGAKATVSDRRRGKWRALNDAAKLASCEWILFVDSDTRIVELASPNGCDVLELRKEVGGSSLMERLANIDYFNMFLSSKIASKFGSCLSINGSAFWIRRSVLMQLGGFRKRINEDTDLGVRIGLAGYRFDLAGRAATKAPKTLRDWLSQRERWAVGGAEVLLENFWRILAKPKLWIPYLTMFIPAMLGFLLSFAFPNIVLDLMYLVLTLSAFIPFKLVSVAGLAVFHIHTVKNIFAMSISFAAWSLIMIAASKLTGFDIDYRLLPVYFLLYSPLWTMICIAAFFKVLFCRIAGREPRVDGWKV